MKKNLYAGAILGVLPFIDIISQEALIKPDAIEKAQKIFGLSYDSIVKEENKLLPKIGYNVGVGMGEGIGGGLIRNIVPNVQKTVNFFFKSTMPVEETVNATQMMINSIVKGGCGIATLGISAIVGMCLGYYFTSKDFDSIVDKLYQHYIRDSSEIGKSYEQAAYYLETMGKKYQNDPHK